MPVGRCCDALDADGARALAATGANDVESHACCSRVSPVQQRCPLQNKQPEQDITASRPILSNRNGQTFEREVASQSCCCFSEEEVLEVVMRQGLWG